MLEYTLFDGTKGKALFLCAIVIFTCDDVNSIDHLYSTVIFLELSSVRHFNVKNINKVPVNVPLVVKVTDCELNNLSSNQCTGESFLDIYHRSDYT